MRALIIAAAATAVGFALPAAAQNNGSWNSNQSSQQQGYDEGGANLQQKIRQDLGQAGFTDIHVVPRSFVVSARDRDGNPVEMMITPHSITAMTSAMPNQNGSGQGGQSYGQNNENGWNSGRGTSGTTDHGWPGGGNGYSQNQNGWNNNGYNRNSNGQSYSQNDNGWNSNQNGPMGDNGMGNSAESGSSINSPNGNGSYSR